MILNKWMRWVGGIWGAWYAILSVIPPHVQYLDQICAFFAGGLVMGLIADATLGRAVVALQQNAEVIDLTEANEDFMVEKTGEEN